MNDEGQAQPAVKVGPIEVIGTLVILVVLIFGCFSIWGWVGQGMRHLASDPAPEPHQQVATDGTSPAAKPEVENLFGRDPRQVVQKMNAAWTSMGNAGAFVIVDAESKKMVSACRSPGLCIDMGLDVDGHVDMLGSHERLSTGDPDEIGMLSGMVATLGAGEAPGDPLKALTLLALKEGRPQRTDVGGHCLGVSFSRGFVFTTVGESSCSR